MRIALIGMSGSGKTYWSKRLAQRGFVRFCCDDMIEQKLEHELIPLGYAGIADVSRWMGQPYDARYGQTSSKYLQFEEDSMQEIIAAISSLTPAANVVIDTTGSVIYTGSTTLQQLKEVSRIVYLETSQLVQKKMYELYLQDPKPVIWGSSFDKKTGETDLSTLARCYPDLIAYRNKRYQQYADCTIAYSVHQQKNLSIDQFLALIG